MNASGEQWLSRKMVTGSVNNINKRWCVAGTFYVWIVYDVTRHLPARPFPAAGCCPAAHSWPFLHHGGDRAPSAGHLFCHLKHRRSIICETINPAPLLPVFFGGRFYGNDFRLPGYVRLPHRGPTTVIIPVRPHKTTAVRTTNESNAHIDYLQFR